MSCLIFFKGSGDHRELHPFPTRRSSDLPLAEIAVRTEGVAPARVAESIRTAIASLDPDLPVRRLQPADAAIVRRSEEHTSELQSRQYLVCRLLLEQKKIFPTHLLLALST